MIRRAHAAIVAAVTFAMTLTLDTSVSSAQAASSPWRLSAGLTFGALIANVEVGRDQIAGGETLIGTLGHGPLLGVRGGVERRFIGVEGELAGIWRPITVTGVSGAKFGNHGAAPTWLGFDGAVYPFGNWIAGGRFRPAISGGVAALVLSADLDNVDGQTIRLVPGGMFRAGLKWMRNAIDDTYFDVAVTLARFRSVRPFGAFRVRTITCGVSYRF